MVGGSGSWPEHSVMAALRPEEREALLASGTQIEFPHDSFLVRQGESKTDLFVLLDGYVKIEVTTEDGVSAILAIRARGDLVGEFAVLDGGERTANAIAVNTVIAVRVGLQRYEEFVDRFPGVRDVVFKSVVGKMRAATRRRAEVRAWDVRARLAKALYELAAAHGVPSGDAILIPLPLSQFELAGMVGAGESTVERLLHEFRSLKLVRTSYLKIHVLDPEGLRALWAGR